MWDRRGHARRHPRRRWMAWWSRGGRCGRARRLLHSGAHNWPSYPAAAPRLYTWGPPSLSRLACHLPPISRASVRIRAAASAGYPHHPPPLRLWTTVSLYICKKKKENEQAQPHLSVAPDYVDDAMTALHRITRRGYRYGRGRRIRDHTQPPGGGVARVGCRRKHGPGTYATRLRQSRRQGHGRAECHHPGRA
jgi:hypothetical protein